MLLIHDFFKFSTSSITRELFLNFQDLGKVLNFQEPSLLSDYYNGINYEEVTSLEPLVEEYVDNYVMWDPIKLINIHPVTNSPEGERIVGVPILMERVGDNDEMTIQLAHMAMENIVFQSYDAVNNIIFIRMVIPKNKQEAKAVVGERCTVATERSQIGDITTDGALIDTTTEIQEFDGIINAFDGVTMELILDNPPLDQSVLNDSKYIAITHQVLYIMPLGNINSSGIDSYPVSPGSLNLAGFSYVDVGTSTTPQYKVITPKIVLQFDAIGVKHKFMFIIKRNPGFSVYESGFQLLPQINL